MEKTTTTITTADAVQLYMALKEIEKKETCLWLVVLKNIQVLRPIFEAYAELERAMSEKFANGFDKRGQPTFESEERMREWEAAIKAEQLTEISAELFKINMPPALSGETHNAATFSKILKYLINE